MLCGNGSRCVRKNAQMCTSIIRNLKSATTNIARRRTPKRYFVNPRRPGGHVAHDFDEEVRMHALVRKSARSDPRDYLADLAGSKPGVVCGDCNMELNIGRLVFMMRMGNHGPQKFALLFLLDIWRRCNGP